MSWLVEVIALTCVATLPSGRPCSRTAAADEEAEDDVLRSISPRRDPTAVTIDATGIGASLASLLVRALGSDVVQPFVFSAVSKSALGYQLLDAVNAGRSPPPRGGRSLRASLTADIPTSTATSPFFRKFQVV